MPIPWSGLGCCLGAAALFVLGRNRVRDADVLCSVIRVHQLKDFAQLFDMAYNALPLIVMASGRVESETPLKCQNSSLRAVMVEETAEQLFLKHNDAGSWVQDSALMLSMCKEVPWYLDDGTGHVYVIGARNATGLVLTLASELFEESGHSLVHGTLDYLQGLKMIGVKRIERILPTNTPLTVVGEAIKDDTGEIRIQQPHVGPFYVSPKSIDELITNHRKLAKWYKLASMGFSVFGIYLLAKHVLEYILEKRRRWELQERVIAAARRLSQDIDGAELNKGCVICLEKEYNAVFVPCGHMCCCILCSSHLINCPLCRRSIEKTVRAFPH